MEEEQTVEEPTEAPVEETTEGETTEAPVEEAPVEEAAEEEAGEEEAPAEEKSESECCCSPEATKSAENMVRDLVNTVNVMKEEEVEGVTTRVQPAAADELVAKLEELAKKVSEICG